MGFYICVLKQDFSFFIDKRAIHVFILNLIWFLKILLNTIYCNRYPKESYKYLKNKLKKNKKNNCICSLWPSADFFSTH